MTSPTTDYDVIVIGAGSAGIAAAISSARRGARTLLVESAPMLGGELISGISLLGCLSTRGEWIVGGVVTELLTKVKALGGYIGPVFDYRALHLVCFDTELMKIAVMQAVDEAGVQALVQAFFCGIEIPADAAPRVRLVHKGGERWLSARVVIDCSGDGEVAVQAGARSTLGAPGTGPDCARCAGISGVDAVTPAVVVVVVVLLAGSVPTSCSTRRVNAVFSSGGSSTSVRCTAR